MKKITLGILALATLTMANFAYAVILSQQTPTITPPAVPSLSSACGQLFQENTLTPVTGIAILDCGPGFPAFTVVNQKDRKSTRLNSSHDQISYAVFCLKKKKKKKRDHKHR